MSNVENISRVYLLNVPLEKDYKHTLYFDTKEAQQEYFQSRIVAKYEDFSYIKKENVLRIPKSDMNNLATNHDQLLNLGVNYVMYQNKNFSNKWFYAFINDLKYINDERTDIEIQTDVIQTWLFDYGLRDCFVEREHVEDDTFGLHTVPENLELGEYICNSSKHVDMGEPCIVMGTTQVGTSKKQGGLYGGVYSGVHYIAWKLTDYESVNSFIASMDGSDNEDNGGYADAIQCIFIAPNFLLDITQTGTYTTVKKSNVVTKDQTENLWINKNTSVIDDYAPSNNKLFTYPFNYLLVSNNNGISAVYRYEDFSGNSEASCDFKMVGSVTPGCSIKLIPKNYKGVDENLEESINAGKFPICNWNSDVFTNWLTQNGVNIGISVTESALQIAGGAGLSLTGAGALAGGPMVASGIQSIAGTLGQLHAQSFAPPQVQGNVNCGDVLQGIGKNTFSMYQMSIKQQFARIIDKYFDCYGYQVNQIKTPNKNHRKEWWYTKTIDANIYGAIPQNDADIIRSCYDKGITFWRNPSRIKLYYGDNSTI